MKFKTHYTGALRGLFEIFLHNTKPRKRGTARVEVEVEQQPDWEQTVIGQANLRREKRVPLDELCRVRIEGMRQMAEKMIK